MGVPQEPPDDHGSFPARRRLVPALREDLQSQYSQFDLRCDQRVQPALQGCFFFSSDEHLTGEAKDVHDWEGFIDAEMRRGVNLAI